eukprot:scaffold115446_cov36-Tisochrysis_lutea.AAC.1
MCAAVPHLWQSRSEAASSHSHQVNQTSSFGYQHQSFCPIPSCGSKARATSLCIEWNLSVQTDWSGHQAEASEQSAQRCRTPTPEVRSSCLAAA